MKNASKSSLSWRGKCGVFLLELYLAIDPSNLTRENDVAQLAPSLSWRGKCGVFLLELYLAIDPSNLTRENDVAQLAELQMHVQK